MNDSATDTLEAPAPDQPDAPPSSGLTVWIPAARLPVLVAMEAAGIAVIDEPDGADYAIISTRLARHRISEYTSQAAEGGLSVVVLVHPGGESIAVEALRAGGSVAIAEGDPDALRALSADVDLDTARLDSLLDAYEARLGRTQVTVRTNVALFDPVSGLPAAGALATRMASNVLDPDLNLRMVAIKVPGLFDPLRLRLGTEGQALMHRRIATALRLMCQPLGDLYDNSDGSFLLLAPHMSIAAAEQLGHTLADIVGSYTPDGHAPLAVAVGHAGPECSTDLATLRELAGRAENAASQDDRSAVLGAGELVGPLATATELEVTLRLADLADSRAGAVSRDAVTNVAGELAVRLGFEGRERTMIRFCAQVSDIGAALSNDVDSQAALAERVLGATAGPTVTGVLRALGEHWDGSGNPGELAGAQIPIAARIIAVATALVTSDYAIESIAEQAGIRYDPTVVAAAQELVKQR